jgi:hypothetical protein
VPNTIQQNTRHDNSSINSSSSSSSGSSIDGRDVMVAWHIPSTQNGSPLGSNAIRVGIFKGKVQHCIACFIHNLQSAPQMVHMNNVNQQHANMFSAVSIAAVLLAPPSLCV